MYDVECAMYDVGCEMYDVECNISISIQHLTSNI